MKKIFSPLGIILSCLIFLSACEVQPDKVTEVDGQKQCDRPELLNQYQQLLNNNFDLLSNKIIGKLYTDIVDQKIVYDAMLKSQVVLDQFVLEANTNADGQYTICNAQLKVVIPQELVTVAKQNSSLIYKPIEYDTEIANVSNINGVERDANIVKLQVRYTLAKDKNQQTMVDNSELDRLNQTLVRMLLPVGIRDTITINGDEEVDKEDAIQQIISQVGMNTEGANEIVDSTEPSENIDELRIKNQRTRNNMHKIWNSMDDTIKNTLSADQYDWNTQLNAQCQKQFEQLTNKAEKEIQVLKCQTNATVERINYLSGFVLPE